MCATPRSPMISLVPILFAKAASQPITYMVRIYSTPARVGRISAAPCANAGHRASERAVSVSPQDPPAPNRGRSNRRDTAPSRRSDGTGNTASPPHDRQGRVGRISEAPSQATARANGPSASFAPIRLLRLADAPIGGILPRRDAAMERGIRPVHRMIDKPVPDRVEVDMVHVSGIVPLVADRMFPEAKLPDAALAPPAPDRRATFGRRQRIAERLLQFAPAAGTSSSFGGSVQMQSI